MTKIPESYRRPAQAILAARTECYWIVEHDNQPGTQVYTVSGVNADGQHIIAEKCYLHWAVRIVDGLRATT
jgi:hypothetical protein